MRAGCAGPCNKGRTASGGSARIRCSSSSSSSSSSRSRVAFYRNGVRRQPLPTSASANGSSNGAGGRVAGPVDVVLSSGFLAFASHSGFLQAVEQAGLPVQGVMGTSAGALAGSLYCAGYTPREVAALLSRDPPIALLRPPTTPWVPQRGGFFSLEGVIARLRDLLPPTFEALGREFAVGVMTRDGKHLLVDSGPLPEAVAASAAIPWLFQAVDIPGFGRRSPFRDGGCVDRVGLRAWRERRHRQAAATARQVPPALVHVISRSSPFSGLDNVDAVPEEQVTVLHSPQSGVSLLSLGDFEGHMAASLARAGPQLSHYMAAVAAAAGSGEGGSSSSSSSSGGGSEEQFAGTTRG